eukprot:1640994-Rhodomonas_salina.1
MGRPTNFLALDVEELTNHTRYPKCSLTKSLVKALALPELALVAITLQRQQDCWGPTVTNSIRKEAEESGTCFILRLEEAVEAELATSREADS